MKANHLASLLVVIIATAVHSTSRICQRTLAKSVDHVFFMPTSRPFVYVMYNEAERIDISALRQSYLDTVTYLYSKVPTSPKTPPLYVHASKILAPTGNQTIYVLHVEQPPGMTVGQSNVLYSAFGEFIDLETPAELQIQSCTDSTYSQNWECPTLNQSVINGILSYDQRIYSGNTPIITPVTPINGNVPIGTYATITSCSAGYAASVTETVVFICGHIQGPQTTGGWNIDPSMKAYCEPVCNALTASANGVITYAPSPPASGTVPTTTVATLTCDPNYIPADNTKTTATCTAANTWNTVLTTCVPTCRIPGSHSALFDNGVISYSPSAPIGIIVPQNTIATLTCDLGYISTQTTSTCVGVNTWSPVLTICNLVHCMDPTSLFVTPDNKTLTYSCSGSCTGVQPYNKNVTVGCDGGDTVLDGTFDDGKMGREDTSPFDEQLTLTCNAQGKWQTTLTNVYPPYPPPITGTVSNSASIICQAYIEP